ncbi:hypothetical protein CcaCcLH18_07567 [Colletotrichum camelliae]|nr:hypothetical protein CcaCcLH18_07567 [Colletotrichum camelliae]
MRSRGTMLELRRRVLISPRYDEAMENVDRSLREVSKAVQKLLEINEKGPGPAPKDSPSSYISSNPSNITVMSEGYRGDSSFKAHVHKVTDALRDAASNLELTMGDPTFTTTTHMIDETADSEESIEPYNLQTVSLG